MLVSILESFLLGGRKAVVTGAGGALGRAIAEALSEAGAALALLGRSESVEVAADEIVRAGGSTLAVRVDLADREQLVRRFEEAVERLGGLDVLVASHGTVHSHDSLEHDLVAWDDTLEVNLTSVFELCQLAGRIMVPQGRGKIVNVASMLSFSGGLRVPAYAASKGAVAQLTKALANEWASSGVNVNAIAPGYIRTRLNEHVWRDPERSQQVLARLPAGRWGTPSDLKGAVVFLASAASDYVHGAIVPMDGGWLAR